MAAGRHRTRASPIWQSREKKLFIRTIVAALALETDKDPIAGRALQLARQHGARLILVHVLEDTLLDDADLPGSLDVTALRGVLERDAAERIGKLTGNPGADMVAETVVDAGKPFQIITEVAARAGADLIVIGPGKAKNMREKVFGSTADHIVRSSSRPVLVVRSPTPDPYQRLSVAVDFSAASQAAAKAAMRLAPDAAVEFVHAIEIPLGFELAMLRAGTSQAEINRYRRARASEARKQISAVFAEIDLPVVPKMRVIQGATAQALVRLTRSGRTDLIALGTHGGNALSQVLLGSVARHVLRAAECDVLVSTDLTLTA